MILVHFHSACSFELGDSGQTNRRTRPEVINKDKTNADSPQKDSKVRIFTFFINSSTKVLNTKRSSEFCTSFKLKMFVGAGAKIGTVGTLDVIIASSSQVFTNGAQ